MSIAPSLIKITINGWIWLVFQPSKMGGKNGIAIPTLIHDIPAIRSISIVDLDSVDQLHLT